MDFHFLINRTAKNPAIVLLDLINDLNNAILNDYQLKGQIEEGLFGLGDIDYSNEITELEKRVFLVQLKTLNLLQMDMEEEIELVEEQQIQEKYYAINSFSTVIDNVSVNFKKGDEVKASQSVLEFFVKINKIK